MCYMCAWDYHGASSTLLEGVVIVMNSSALECLLHIVGSYYSAHKRHHSELFLYLYILAVPSLVSTVRLKVTSPMNPSSGILTVTHTSVHPRVSRTRWLDISNPTTNPVTKKSAYQLPLLYSISKSPTTTQGRSCEI